MKRLRRSYTSLEMDVGEGMIFHPVSGENLSAYYFHRRSGCFFPCNGDGDNIQDRIGDGLARQQGDPYPSHWRFDPDTGKKLKKCHRVEPASSGILTGWEMD